MREGTLRTCCSQRRRCCCPCRNSLFQIKDLPSNHLVRCISSMFVITSDGKQCKRQLHTDSTQNPEERRAEAYDQSWRRSFQKALFTENDRALPRPRASICTPQIATFPFSPIPRCSLYHIHTLNLYPRPRLARFLRRPNMKDGPIVSLHASPNVHSCEARGIEAHSNASDPRIRAIPVSRPGERRVDDSIAPSTRTRSSATFAARGAPVFRNGVVGMGAFKVTGNLLVAIRYRPVRGGF